MRSSVSRKSSGRSPAADDAVKTMLPAVNGIGSIQIHEDVIASLVRRAALSVEGVSRLAGSSLVDNIAEIVGSHRMQTRSVSVDIGSNNNVAVDVKVNVLFGYPIPEIASRIQRAVVEEVEPATGMTVTAVNVLIQDIEDVRQEHDGEDAEDENDGTDQQ